MASGRPKASRKLVHGFIYLLTHPLQLKHIIIRETRYRLRHQSKQKWVEWQLYDACMSTPLHSTPVAHARPLNVARVQTISDMISRIGNGLCVLDVGCGDGSIGEPLREKGNRVISVELPKIVKIAQSHRVPLLVAGDAEHLAFASESFDVVIASEVVEHLWDPLSFFNEAYRVLRTNGYLVMSTPEGLESLRYDSHKHYFTEEGLRRMLGARFSLQEVKRLKPMGAPTPTLILLFRKL
ncbi:MAG: methyltransferase domain-containing protein [Candidatus Bathyarchaeales archaeon]